jgi:hypothetical protein
MPCRMDLALNALFLADGLEWVRNPVRGDLFIARTQQIQALFCSGAAVTRGGSLLRLVAAAPLQNKE